MDAASNQPYQVVRTGKGTTRQILSENPELMTVVFRFEQGSIGDLHSHEHVQSTYVLEGHFIFYLDDREVELSAGESLIVPGNMVHGCKALKVGALIDTFTPRRDDFL